MVPPRMGAESFDKVLYEVAGGVATVTLNDPDKRNMLSGAMLTEVVAAMEMARDSEEVRAVVLTGAGCSTNSGIPDYRDVDGNWKRSSR